MERRLANQHLIDYTPKGPEVSVLPRDVVLKHFRSNIECSAYKCTLLILFLCVSFALRLEQVCKRANARSHIRKLLSVCFSSVIFHFLSITKIDLVQSEIIVGSYNLEIEVLIYENVLRFQITMNNAALVVKVLKGQNQ